MSDQQQKPAVKKSDPVATAATNTTEPATTREKVRIRWALGGPFTDGEFDEAKGTVYCLKNNKPVRISFHGGLIAWLE